MRQRVSRAVRALELSRQSAKVTGVVRAEFRRLKMDVIKREELLGLEDMPGCQGNTFSRWIGQNVC